MKEAFEEVGKKKKRTGRAERTLISIISGSNEETWSVWFTSKACLCGEPSMQNKDVGTWTRGFLASL